MLGIGSSFGRSTFGVARSKIVRQPQPIVDRSMEVTARDSIAYAKQVEAAVTIARRPLLGALKQARIVDLAEVHRIWPDVFMGNPRQYCLIVGTITLPLPTAKR